jgi:hypothetical protein
VEAEIRLLGYIGSARSRSVTGRVAMGENGPEADPGIGDLRLLCGRQRTGNYVKLAMLLIRRTESIAAYKGTIMPKQPPPLRPGEPIPQPPGPDMPPIKDPPEQPDIEPIEPPDRDPNESPIRDPEQPAERGRYAL